MYLIVGLGNPEEEYSNTRHNMGFDSINKLAEKYDIKISKNKFQALYGTGIIEGEKVVLLKPQTYMNLSGISVKQFMDYYRLNSSELIVVYDDLDVEKGSIKIRKQGGPGTHNGMKSVVHELKSTDFFRIRVGIGVPENEQDLANYVLEQLSEEEGKVLGRATKIAADAIESILTDGIDNAMNKFN